MFLNCGRVIPLDGGGVRIEIWQGDETFEFMISQENLIRLLRDEKSVPVGRKFGVLENPNYGRATLSRPNDAGERKGVMFRADCFKRRTFSVARKALEHVARRKWQEASVSEIIPDPVPRTGTIRMGVAR